MSTEKTVERKAETKNSISRLVFVAISILLEIGVFVIIITKLNEYAQWINKQSKSSNNRLSKYLKKIK